MNIKMISPRTIYNRKPLGKYVLEKKNTYKENYPDVQNNIEFYDHEKKEFWIVKTVSNQQYELYVNGCQIVLHSFTSMDNNHMFTGFTETPIKCASFACLSSKTCTNATIESIFEDLHKSSPKGVILFTENIAKYYGFNAEIHTCKLPCRVSSAWAFRNCLFVEREETSESMEYSPHSLFVLTHTLAELTPVVYRDEFGHCGFINNTRFRIVAVCEVSFLLLAYDKIDDMFSLWRIRDANKEDFASLYGKHLDGSISVNMEKLHCNSFSFRSHSESMSRTILATDNSHVSSEYFEIHSDSLNASRSIDDLDIRSPIARSRKQVKDDEKPDKMALLHEVINIGARSIGCGLRHTVEPLFPKVCLDLLFQFKPANTDEVFHSTPILNGGSKIKLTTSTNESKGFFAEDFYRRKYLCCLKSVDNQKKLLQIIKFNYENHNFNHLDEQSYHVLDAVFLDRLKLIIMLEMSSTLSIYTGNSFVCKISLLNSLIYEPNLFVDTGNEMATDEINNMVKLSEPADYGFTIHTRSGVALRLYLQEMVRFHLVKKCLLVLKKLLPIHVGMTLLCRWYSLNRAVENNEATSAEWRRFVEFLLENIGFTENNNHDNSIVRDVKGLCLNTVGTGPQNHDCGDTNVDDMTNLDEIHSKKLRTNAGLYSIKTRCINRDRLDDYSGLSHNIRDRLLSRYATTVLFSLHLVYESEKINYSSCTYLDNLAALNCSLAFSIEASKYVEYYVAHDPDLWSRINKLPSIVNYICPHDNEAVWTNDPPDWVNWFQDILSDNAVHHHKYPIIDDFSEMILHLVKIWLVIFRHENLVDNAEAELNNRLYRINFNMAGKPTRYPVHVPSDIATGITKGIITIDNLFERIASYLGEINFRVTDLDYINCGLAAIFRIIFSHGNKYPHLYNILHRSDLDKQRQLIMPIIKENSVPEVMSNPLQKFRSLSESRRNCYSYWTNNVKPFTNIRQLTELVKTDHHYLLDILNADPIVRLSYPDLRIHEAYRMLQSCCPIELDVTICNNFTAEDGDSLSNSLKEELEGYLKIINCQRTFCLPIGRGMLGLHVVQSNLFGEKLPVPPLCLTGKFSLSESGKPQSIDNNGSTKQWPNFHNGVASGLMMGPFNDSVDYVWILKQCSSTNIDKIELTPEQSGILLGLGLNGHLNKLSHDTLGQLIKSMNEMATMAILIGLSAFNLGSKNSVLSKHISFHYRRLIPGEKDQNDPIPTLCQVSAIISAGLLNFKSGDRKMAKIFIEEMGRSREHLTFDGSPPMDIELTSVTSGFSVGLIMFQQGDVFCREYNSEEMGRLMSYLKGTYRYQSKESVTAENPTDLQIRTIIKNHDLKKPQPISEVDNWDTFHTKNPRVQEGEYYNVDITGSGAAVALGLIFMDSNNNIIADHLKCPSTFYLLEQIRSPLMCFRQIAHGLIMWRDVKPTQQWVDSTIPEFVSSKAFVSKPNGIAEKYLETANESYLQMLVGSCFVMGLRYAGTDNVGARTTIVNYVEKLLYIKTDNELMQNINRNQYDWAVSTLFLSACMVSAGSGDLQLLRMSRYLRSIHYPKECSNYGVNMTHSMSIGLLFLGGGKLTLSNTPRCAALLLISFFPRFPPTYSGRRYHLQALRHLYVIATRPRVMCAVDLDTQIAVPFDSRIKIKNEAREYHGCLVFPSENPALIEEIELFDKNDEYWPQIYKPGTEPWNILLQSFLSGGYFFVKKKSPDTEIKQYVSEFAVEKLTRGYQVSDYRLFYCFVDRINQHATDESSIIFCYTRIHDTTTDFILSHKSGLKRIITRLSSVDTSNFRELALFYDWIHQNGFMKIWSTFSSYFNLPVHILKSVAATDHPHQIDTLDESVFIISEILE